MELRDPPLIVAVPRLAAYQPHSGIGRVLCSVSEHWRGRVRLVNAALRAPALPIVRNFPSAIIPDRQADVLLLPQLTGARALRGTRHTPSIVVVHDVGIVDLALERRTMDRLTRRSILDSFWSLRHASLIITVSNWTRDRLLHYLPDVAERVRVIPNGVASHFWQGKRTQQAARLRFAEYGVSVDAPLLLYVGSESPRKNITLLLHTLQQIKRMHPEAQLLKIGQPGRSRWRANTLQQIQHLGLGSGKDVIIIDHLDDSTLVDAYTAADVFVSPSLYEGFGLPAVEAMAVGTPVVVTNRGAFPEVVGDAGWVVDPDAEAFVEAIKRVLDRAIREEYMERGRARAAYYTWSRASEAYVESIASISNGTYQGAMITSTDQCC